MQDLILTISIAKIAGRYFRVFNASFETYKSDLLLYPIQFAVECIEYTKLPPPENVSVSIRLEYVQAQELS